MVKINLDLESIDEFLDNSFSQKQILKHCIAAELAGIDGIFINTGNNYDENRKKIIENLISNLDINVSVKSSLDSKWIETLLEIKPSMVIFPYNEEDAESVKTHIFRFQNENILTGIEVKTNIDSVKKALKIRPDYLILNCESFCSTEKSSDEINELTNIFKIASLASKLSTGIIASGDFNKRKLRKITDLKIIQEITLSRTFISDTIIDGYKKSIEVLRSTIT